MPEPKPTAAPEYDTTYLNSLREAYVIIALFAVFCFWSLFVCFNYGYLGPDEQLSEVSTVLGMPSWAFWGIGLPWIAVDAVAVWFCFFYMKNDDLGEAHEGQDLAEQIAHLHDGEEATGE
jgi:Na+/melibiose symporter-like transporter